MRTFRILLLCCAIVPCAAIAQSASDSAGAPDRPIAGSTQSGVAPLELAFAYSYLRSNANPGQCGCFNMNGGNAEAALHVYRGLSLAADFSGENTANVNNGGRGLSLISFTAGPRISFVFHRRFVPFAQGLFGAAHGFNSYFPVTAGPTGAATDFAMIAGGGFDVRIARHIAIRPIEADYFLTRLPNGVNGAQNNLRLSAGMVLRIR
jgi:peptidoglycan-associated lipoprotein